MLATQQVSTATALHNYKKETAKLALAGSQQPAKPAKPVNDSELNERVGVIERLLSSLQAEIKKRDAELQRLSQLARSHASEDSFQRLQAFADVLQEEEKSTLHQELYGNIQIYDDTHAKAAKLQSTFRGHSTRRKLVGQPNRSSPSPKRPLADQGGSDSSRIDLTQEEVEVKEVSSDSRSAEEDLFSGPRLAPLDDSGGLSATKLQV